MNNIEIAAGMVVYTDTGSFSHFAKTETKAVCGKNIWKLAFPEQPFRRNVSCKTCQRSAR